MTILIGVSWSILAVVVYAAGYVTGNVLYRKHCKHGPVDNSKTYRFASDDPHYMCSHDGHPALILWPLALPFALVFAPFFFGWLGLIKLSRRLAG